MAKSGAMIIRWLANRRKKLALARPTKVLDETVIQQKRHSTKPTVSPTDFDLVDACEQWLAVTGTPEQDIEDFTQPSERVLRKELSRAKPAKQKKPIKTKRK